MQITVGIDAKSHLEVQKNFKQYQLKLQEARKPIIEKGLQIIVNLWKAKLASHHLTGQFESEATYKLDDHKRNFTVGRVGCLNADKYTAIGMNALEYGHATPGMGRDASLLKRNEMRAAGKKFKRLKRGRRWTDYIIKKIPAYPTIRPALDESKRPVKALIGSEIKKMIKGLPGGGD
jgi:hypothetical protein